MPDTTTNRTSAGLRDVLFDEIDALRKPKGNPRRALAVASLAKQIISTVEAELRFAALTKTLDRVPLGSLPLGSSSGTPTAVSAETTAAAA